jgi:N-acetylneuraminic acid mutarotase
MCRLTIGVFLVAGLGVLGSGATMETLVWKQMVDLPRPVAGYMAGVSHGNLFVIGGSFWEAGKKQWTAKVQIFDPLANSWREGPPLNEPRSDAACATLHDDIYFFGGGAGNEVRRDAQVLHNGAWRALPEGELPEPRLFATAVAYEDSIYLLGGMGDAGDYRKASAQFWRWRPGNKRWQLLASLPGPGRISHAMAVIGKAIYVFGGAAAAGAGDVKNLNDVYRYDPQANRWTRLPDLPVANRAWWALSLGNSALVLAGYTDDYARAVYQYTPQNGLQMIGSLPHGLADTKFFLINNLVVGTGGETGPGIRGKWTLQAEIPKDMLAKVR